MLHVRQDALTADWLTQARWLAADSRVEQLQEVVAERRAAVGAPLSPDDEVELGVLVATALLNRDDYPAARGALERVRPMLAAASPLRQGRFHASMSATACRSNNHDKAVTEAVQALAAVESEAEPSEELALVLGGAGMNLANAQLFPLAVETTLRAVDEARRAGCQTARYHVQTGYSNVCWAMRAEHLGLAEEGRQRWSDAEQQFSMGLRLAAELAQLWQAHALAYRALCAARLGDGIAAEAELVAARAVRLQPVTPDLRRLLHHVEAATLLAQQRYDQARTVLSEYWAEAGPRSLSPWVEDAALLLSRVAEACGDHRTALRWHRELHERYGRAQYQAWLARATTARLQIDQEALQRRARQLEYDALSDPLTGVPNRRAFDANLLRLVAAAHSTAKPLTLVIFDVDRFKRVNDTHGHPAGDEVLRRVARILREQSRDVGRCARYGGDEFTLCLSVESTDAAIAVSRISRSIAEHPWASVAPGLAVSVSTGVAELRPADDAVSLLWTADQSLLAAKRSRAPEPFGSAGRFDGDRHWAGEHPVDPAVAPRIDGVPVARTS